MRILPASSFLFALLLGGLAAGQDVSGPTLAATADFIGSHIAKENAHFTFTTIEFAGRPDERTVAWNISQMLSIWSDEDFHITGPLCLVNIFLTTEMKGQTGKPVQDVFKFNAHDLKLRDIKVSTRLYSTSRSGAGDVTLPTVELPVSVDTKHPYVLVHDREMAERLANAFRGLGRLCGAKEEAY